MGRAVARRRLYHLIPFCLFLICLNAVLLGLTISFARLWRQLDTELDKNWGPWSEIKSIKYPARVDLHGDRLDSWTYYYQERYHEQTNRYQTRRIF